MQSTCYGLYCSFVNRVQPGKAQTYTVHFPRTASFAVKSRPAQSIQNSGLRLQNSGLRLCSPHAMDCISLRLARFNGPTGQGKLIQSTRFCCSPAKCAAVHNLLARLNLQSTFTMDCSPTNFCCSPSAGPRYRALQARYRWTAAKTRSTAAKSSKIEWTVKVCACPVEIAYGL